MSSGIAVGRRASRKAYNRLQLAQLSQPMDFCCWQNLGRRIAINDKVVGNRSVQLERYIVVRGGWDAWRRAMNYRFVIRDPRGNHPCLVEMLLEDDEVAVELARGFITATACEIWQDGRFVEAMYPAGWTAPNGGTVH
jgi:hypothetical protein